MKHGSLAGTLVVLVLSASTTRVAAEDWPQFRGPGGRARSNGTGLPTQWDENTNLGWRLQLPGPGSSSPIVSGRSLFVTCYSGYGTNGAGGSSAALKRHLLCVDTDTGAIRWSRTVPSTATEDRWGRGLQEHGYASNTPACDGERVVVFFGKTGVLAYDLDGKELWQRSLGTASSNRRWGSASSPILHGDVVIVNASEESRTIYALDKQTGDTAWKVEAEKTELTYGTPALAALADGRQELVVAVPNEVWGFNPENGECTWWVHTDLAGNISPSVLAVGDVAYVLGGYPRVGSVAIRAGGKGDVKDSHLLWTSRDSSYIPSPLEYEGHLYWVSERSEAHCVDAGTGELIYKEKLDAGRGQAFYASVVFADGKLYATSRRSGTFVLAAKPEFELLSVNTFRSDQTDFNGTPAISDGRIFMRSNRYLYCIRQSGE